MQFEYPEGDIPLRFLRLKHENARQNITYNCDSGVDGFMLAKILGANGDTLTFEDKTIRMISEVNTCNHMYTPTPTSTPHTHTLTHTHTHTHTHSHTHTHTLTHTHPHSLVSAQLY